MDTIRHHFSNLLQKYHRRNQGGQGAWAPPIKIPPMIKNYDNIAWRCLVAFFFSVITHITVINKNTNDDEGAPGPLNNNQGTPRPQTDNQGAPNWQPGAPWDLNFPGILTDNLEAPSPYITTS